MTGGRWIKQPNGIRLWKPARTRKHGSHAAYNYHLRLNEIACDPCLAAERHYRNRRNQERRTATT